MKNKVFLGAIVLVCTTLVTNSFSSSTNPTNSEAEETYAIARISSSPSGALVMLSKQAEFDEMTAQILGKTPIMRRMQIAGSGSLVHLTKPGYEEWAGRISVEAPIIKAEMIPLPDADRQGITGSRFNKVTVVPARIGIRKIGTSNSEETLSDFEVSELATSFRHKFMNTLGDHLKSRFSENITVENNPKLETDEFWLDLETVLTGIRPDKIGFYPKPISFEFEPRYSDILSSIGDGVLLIRSEAYYHTTGQHLARGIIPILLTLASRGVAEQNAQPGQIYQYRTYSSNPSIDSIIVQQLLIDSETKELMWFSQTVLPDNFSREQVTETFASKIASQLPSAFLLNANN